MQLIIKPEDPIISIKDKMSAFDEETINEKPLTSGDIKEIVEANGKVETNDTSDKENGQNKENILNNSDEIENHKEVGDVVSTEKPVEECSVLIEEKLPEEKDIIQDKPELDTCEVDEKEQPDTVETEKPQPDEEEELNLDKKQEPELSNNVPQISENVEAELNSQEKSQSKENVTPELDDNEKLEIVDMNATNKEPVLSSVEDISVKTPGDEHPKETQNIITEEKKNSPDEENVVELGTEENVVSMEVDNTDVKNNEGDQDNFSEKDITQSISDMVENIVQNLNEANEDDSLENIGIENVDETLLAEKDVPQNIDEENVAKEIAKTDTAESIQKDESKTIETSLEPIVRNDLEEDQHKMDVDLEPINAVTEVLVQPDSTSVDPRNQPETILSSDHVSGSIKPTSEDSQKLVIDSNQIDRSESSNIAQNSNNLDMNLETTAKDDPVEINVNRVSQDGTTATIDKEVEQDNVNAMETENTEVIDLKSADSSVNNSDDVDSSIGKMEDDIIRLAPGGIEKVSDETSENTTSSGKQDCVLKDNVSEAKDDDVEEVKMIEDTKTVLEQRKENEKTPEKVSSEKSHTPLITLSNTLDILSDEEDDSPSDEPPKNNSQDKMAESTEKQCIDLVDDDDIMLIDEDTTKEEKKDTPQAEEIVEKVDESPSKNDSDAKNIPDTKHAADKTTEETTDIEKDSTKLETDAKEDLPSQEVAPEPAEPVSEVPEKPKPLIPQDFFKTYRKNLADMTRDDLEEFCILKIVESIIDRSNLNEIRSKLKTMGQTIEEYKKKAMMLTKQNRDLQVVLKSVQEEQKKTTGNQPITPLKITRSVGMQVLMTDKNRRRTMPVPGGAANTANNVNQVNNRNVRNPGQSPRNTPQKSANNQTIPVPRLVPAGSNVVNKPVPVIPVNNHAKATAVQNGVKNISPAQKPEKRTHSRMQSQSSSVTVDLTDDEPPSKVATKASPAPPVRLVNPQNLLAPRQQFSQQVNSPRKVYIPISLNGPQANVRPGQTIMLKTVSSQGPRPRGPTTSVVRAPQNVQMRRVGPRHPAPLPDAMKQYQPPNWKALPPAPDLKLSKVENGIVISWKIEGYQEDSYEEIASYQLYAYQETSAPASTALWKKIGDVKALPLPMACTLTQFMAGYKYYFAVRAVDIKSRLGPFSLPGSILLLNKM